MECNCHEVNRAPSARVTVVRPPPPPLPPSSSSPDLSTTATITNTATDITTTTTALQPATTEPTTQGGAGGGDTITTRSLVALTTPPTNLPATEDPSTTSSFAPSSSPSSLLLRCAWCQKILCDYCSDLTTRFYLGRCTYCSERQFPDLVPSINRLKRHLGGKSTPERRFTCEILPRGSVGFKEVIEMRLKDLRIQTHRKEGFGEVSNPPPNVAARVSENDDSPISSSLPPVPPVASLLPKIVFQGESANHGGACAFLDPVSILYIVKTTIISINTGGRSSSSSSSGGVRDPPMTEEQLKGRCDGEAEELLLGVSGSSGGANTSSDSRASVGGADPLGSSRGSSSSSSNVHRRSNNNYGGGGGRSSRVTICYTLVDEDALLAADSLRGGEAVEDSSGKRKRRAQQSRRQQEELLSVPMVREKRNRGVEVNYQDLHAHRFTAKGDATTTPTQKKKK